MEKGMLEGQLVQMREDMMKYMSSLQEGMAAQQNLQLRQFQQQQFYGGPV